MDCQALANIVETSQKYLTAKDQKALRKMLLTVYLNEEIAQLESSSQKSVFIPSLNLYRAKEDQIKLLHQQLAGLK